MQGGGSIFALSPSFNSYSSTRFAEIAAKVSDEFCEQREELGLEAAFAKQLSITPQPSSSSSSNPEDEFEFQENQKKDDDENEQVRETQEEVYDSDSDEFEFAFVSKDTESSPISADEIFYNGQIKPIYPVFNRNLIFATTGDDDHVLVTNNKASENTHRFPLGKLFIEEEDRDPPSSSSSSSSEADLLEAVPAGTYCIWTPNSVQASPDRCKKSNSTGSSSKRWRFRDFLLRSNSDGKETFIFLARSASGSGSKSKKKNDNSNNVTHKSEAQPRNSMENTSQVTTTTGKAKAKRVSGEATTISAHEIHYIRNRAVKEGHRRKSYLPYRQDLVGLFANVNGLSKNLHPF